MSISYSIRLCLAMTINNNHDRYLHSVVCGVFQTNRHFLAQESYEFIGATYTNHCVLKEGGPKGTFFGESDAICQGELGS